MKRDFTLEMYAELLTAIVGKNYRIFSFSSYLETTGKQTDMAILRHDVDRFPVRALAMARLEKESRITSTYYFRVRNNVFPEKIIGAIADYGHEIGYHYEDFATARGDFTQAIKFFGDNLERLRRLCPVLTICMHGQPLQPWDNRRLWEKFHYQDFGIRGEPYFDFDFSRGAYLTDTGRRWDGQQVNRRDKIQSDFQSPYRSTRDVIAGIGKGHLPRLLMVNCHPERWQEKWLPWLHQFFWQQGKNIIKKIIISTEQK